MDDIHQACLKGDPVLLAKLLEKGDPNDIDIEMRSPLHCAVSGGSVECASLLLSHKNVELESRDICGYTPLHFAAREGKVETLKLLIKANANPVTTDDFHQTPLHWAAEANNKDVVTALLDSPKIDLTVVDGKKRTPLHIACDLGHAGIVQSLVRKGADVNAVDDDGQTPLHSAIFRMHVKTVKYLLKKGANPTTVDVDGSPPVHIAAYVGNIEIIKCLIQDSHISPSTQDSDGNTPLHVACSEGHPGAVTLLLSLGADPALVDLDGETAIIEVARHNKPECLQAIISYLSPVAPGDSGAEPKKQFITKLVNTATVDGVTPLMLAAQVGAEEIAKILLDAGCDPNLSDNEKLTALHYASENGHTKLCELMLARNAAADCKDHAGNMPAHKAALKGHHTVLASLARGGADLAAVNSSGVTPLMFACIGGYVESVRVLLLFTPPDAILKPDSGGNTPLHVAARHGRDEIIRVLLQNPAAPLDIDQANADGNSPVVLALLEKHVETARVLVAFGASFLLDGILKRKLRHIPEATLAALNAEALMVSKDDRPLTNTFRSTFGAGVSRRSSSAVPVTTGPSSRRRHVERSGSEAISMDSTRHAESFSALSLSPVDSKKLNRQSEVPSRRNSAKRSKNPIVTPLEEHGVAIDPAAQTKPNSAVITRDAISLFETKPEKAINMLIENNLLKDNCSDVATFLYKSSELDSAAMGLFLSETKEFNKSVLESFMTLFDFRELDFDVALRRFLAKFRLPGEAQKIDRLMESFARRYYQGNPKGGPFADQDAVYVLAFSTIMLNTDAHNPSIKAVNKMTKPQFVRNNAGLNGGKNYPEEFLGDLYDRITKNEIKMERQEEIFVNAEKKGWLLKQGGRIKTLSRRWFLLSENVLFSFDKPADKEPSGIIPLENLIVQLSSMKKVKHAFELRSAEGGLIKATMRKAEGGLVVANTECFTFQAASDEEMNEWIEAIRRNVYRNPFHQLMAAKRQTNGSSKDATTPR